MKAVILLRTNPGFQEKAYEVLEEVTKRATARGVKNISLVHCYGRFDGVVTCDCPDSKALSELAEDLRKKGVFHTETLIAIE
ncbi:MAG: hypothetical protein M0P73_10535 [Syntrophobacterales bacterium]|jgi:uncharacterized protein with GYD domain|nr:hypothetical protein [Syntrophobacterales bacterium]